MNNHHPRHLQDPSNIFNHSITEIVGGTPANPGDYPSYVHVANRLLCGGTLIAPDIVLTSASCTTDPWEETEVYVGATDLFGDDGQSERIAVNFVLPHPDYTAGVELNDIMLVSLAASSTTNSLTKLNFDPNFPVVDETVTTLGFGLTSEAGQVSFDLMEVELSVVDFALCEELLSTSTSLEFDEDTMLCAGDLAGGKDACDGDSGGPLYDATAGVQYGIVSYGLGCARPDTPGIYTRVSQYEEWISAFVLENSMDPGAYFDNLPTSAPSGAPSDAPAGPGPLRQENRRKRRRRNRRRRRYRRESVGPRRRHARRPRRPN